MKQGFFPYVVDYASWDDFNGNLFLEYGQGNIVASDETNWQNTANAISQSSQFSIYPVPPAEGYSNWQDWAMDFITIVNGPTR